MSRMSEACPYDEHTRATRCEPCCANHGALPPCVVAWLNVRVNVATVTILPRRDSLQAA
jgi:hypothetical protein